MAACPYASTADLSESTGLGRRHGYAADAFDNGRNPAALRLSFEQSSHARLRLGRGRAWGLARLLSDGVCNAYLIDVWDRLGASSPGHRVPDGPRPHGARCRDSTSGRRRTTPQALYVLLGSDRSRIPAAVTGSGSNDATGEADSSMATSVHDLELPEVDVFDARASRGVIAAFEAARPQHWLAACPMGYMVTRHEDVTAILGERRFHSALSLLPQMSGVDGPIRERQQRSILAMEGDEHTRLRRLVSPAFTPGGRPPAARSCARWSTSLVDPFAAAGRASSSPTCASRTRSRSSASCSARPKEDWKLFSGWATDIFRIFNNDIANDLAAHQGGDGRARRLRAGDDRGAPRRPADDLLSDLIAAEEAGDRLSTDELVMMTEAVLMAGTDTTRNQLACSVALLAQHPDQWPRLAEDPDLAKRAVEETMRYLGAVRGTARVASEDIEYRDVLFPTGTLVVTSLAAANLDPEVWDDPHRFDIEPAAGHGRPHDLRLGHPLLPRRRARPGRAAGGAAAPRPPPAATSSSTARSSGSRQRRHLGPGRLPLRFTPA